MFLNGIANFIGGFMPFKSVQQMRYMYSREPKIAERWRKEYGVPKNLPKRVRKKKRKGVLALANFKGMK
jgi:hypothetical protein